MFIILLRYTEARSSAPQFMPAHMAWVKRGLDDGTFLLVGGIQPDLGGCILASGSSLAELQQRVNEDPFVIEAIVAAEILEVNPVKACEEMSFLLQG